MEKLWIGVDGGGSKTLFCAMRADGSTAAQSAQGSVSYRQYGFDTVVQRIQDGVRECLALCCAAPAAVAGYCFGMPCYGESGAGDTVLQERLTALYAPTPVFVCNDVQVGWAGSLACKSGVNIVAGTGAIAFGRNDAGQTARTGGWTEFFSDEGSGYWIGRRAMSLFSKQADGRLPKAALYTLVRETFHLENDFDFISIIETQYMPYRDKTASFQRFAEEAALAGDTSCVALYAEAAAELAEDVAALAKILALPKGFTVSYSGGLFKAGPLLLNPFTFHLNALNCTLQKPLFTPVVGAALLAREYFSLV